MVRVSWQNTVGRNSALGRFRSRSRPLKPIAQCLPHVEVLEDRTLLSFNAPRSFPVDAWTSNAVAADFTGNGILDLAVTNENYAGRVAAGIR
jgi:hypothetical protein